MDLEIAVKQCGPDSEIQSLPILAHAQIVIVILCVSETRKSVCIGYSTSMSSHIGRKMC